MIRLFPLLFAALLFCACEYDFPLNDESNTPRLYINCLAGYSDSTYINVQTALPINRNTDVKEVKTVMEELLLEVNGVPQTLTPYSGKLLSSYNLYCLPSRIMPSDRVHIVARAKGTGVAEATMEMPARPVIDTVTIVEKAETEYWSSVKADILLEGAISEDSYYGVEMVCRLDDEEWSLYLSSESEEESLTGDGEDGWIDCGVSRFGVEGFAYDYEKYGSNYMSLLDGRSLLERNGHVRFSALVPVGAEYFIRLSAVSEELYHYAKATYHIGNNILANLGLAPALFSYSNVTGGFGVLAGMSHVTTKKYKIEVKE